MELPEIDRSDEVGSSRTSSATGSIEIEVPSSALAKMLCSDLHPMAIALGTIAPGVPCCESCMLFPAS